MNDVLNRINTLREKMVKDNVKYVYVPTDDYHLSENIGDFFKCREYITGFDGSAGVSIVGINDAYLWVDSRYFIQAEEQLKNTSIHLFKMGEKDVPTIQEFLKKNLLKDDVLAVNFSVIDVAFGKFLETLVEDKNVKLLNKDYFEEIWLDRPSISKKQGFSLPLSLSSLTRFLYFIIFDLFSLLVEFFFNFISSSSKA